MKKNIIFMSWIPEVHYLHGLFEIQMKSVRSLDKLVDFIDIFFFFFSVIIFSTKLPGFSTAEKGGVEQSYMYTNIGEKASPAFWFYNWFLIAFEVYLIKQKKAYVTRNMESWYLTWS